MGGENIAYHILFKCVMSGQKGRVEERGEQQRFAAKEEEKGDRGRREMWDANSGKRSAGS